MSDYPSIIIEFETKGHTFSDGTKVDEINPNKQKEEAMFLTEKFLDELMLPKVIQTNNGKLQHNYKWKETDDNYQFFLSVPGVKKADISIEVLDGEILHVIAPENEFINKQNIKLTLPRVADVDNIQARTEDGILIVTVPFLSPKKSPKIEVH